MPAVRVGDVTTTISTLAQLAAAVGVPPPPGLPAGRAAGETVALLDAWVAHLRVFRWDFVSRPTPSRGRTLRELTVNVFSPLELLPAAWESGVFPWYPDDDEARGAAFRTHGELVAWAGEVARRWSDFVAAEQEAFDREPPVLTSPRGPLEWGSLVSAQRWHAAFHYRQLVTFAEAEGVARPRGALELEALSDLALPPDVF